MSESELFEIFRAIESPEEFSRFLEDILTPAERADLGQRAEILRRLLSGATQRKIAEDMAISITTVSRGNRIIEHGTGMIAQIYARLGWPLGR
ncbi:MAG TPA: YerC/YecD family TrpR-related protein [bacterium]|nr:YerC/YecD family TrpR-related protein [bacterium]